MLASLIETCKLNKIEPHSYLAGVLTAIVNGHKQKHIDQLLPWNFKGGSNAYNADGSLGNQTPCVPASTPLPPFFYLIY